jgi:hypothetical protein
MKTTNARNDSVANSFKKFMNYTDEQLKQALADMLPQSIYNGGELYIYDADFARLDGYRHVRDTELLHLCWLVEQDLKPEQKIDYIEILGRGEDEESFYPAIALASDWRWRVAALAEVKEIEI